VKIGDSIISTIKTKGIRNDGHTLEILNIRNMINLVNKFIAGEPQEALVKQWKIVSNKYSHIVKSLDFHKIYRVVSEKRKIDGNDTFPYGFCK